MTDVAFADSAADVPRYMGMSFDVYCDVLLTDGDPNVEMAQCVTQILGIWNEVS